MTCWVALPYDIVVSILWLALNQGIATLSMNCDLDLKPTFFFSVATSVVVSGCYEDDDDNGKTLYYTGETPEIAIFLLGAWAPPARNFAFSSEFPGIHFSSMNFSN